MNIESRYRASVVAALADGWRFADLHASSDGATVHTLLAAPDGSTQLEHTRVESGFVPSIIDLAPAAGWDEREVHDLHGIRFAGHEPLRPLLNHDLNLSHWTVPIKGHDPYQVAVGPIHAGVIESGHFRFHVVGERILCLDARLFYKHRGLERAAAGRTLVGAAQYVGRACAACAVTNTVAYALACEQALGLSATAELARSRTALLELERVWNHLNDIAQICAGVGLAAGTALFAALTERCRRLNQALTGHRFLRDAISLGGSTIHLSRQTVRAARGDLSEIRNAAERGWRELTFNSSFQDRLSGVGILTPEDIHRLGTVGPAARASGDPGDLRRCSPRLAYPDYQPVMPDQTDGDVRARLEQRALELWQTFSLLESLLGRPLLPATAEPTHTTNRFGVGRVESPRGATSCVVETDGDRLVQLRLRTGSYANWPSVAHAAAGNLLPDFPLINKSFELCYACADR